MSEFIKDRTGGERVCRNGEKEGSGSASSNSLDSTWENSRRVSVEVDVHSSSGAVSLSSFNSSGASIGGGASLVYNQIGRW